MATAATAKVKSNGNGKHAGELLNISQIARRIKLDRATTVKRLEANGFEPVDVKAKEKTYRMDAVTLAQLAIKSDERLAAQIRKEKAAAEKIEMQNAQARGELVPAAEFVDVVQRLFGASHKETIRMIKRWSARVVKMKAPAAAEKLMIAEYQRFSNSLRADYKKFLIPATNNGDGKGKR